MGSFNELDIMGEELQMHLGTRRVFQDHMTGEWKYRYGEYQTFQAHSVEAAILYLMTMTDDLRGVDGRGFSRYDVAFATSLRDTISRWGTLSDGQLATVQRRKEYHGKNGLLLKYRKQLEAVGFYIPALLRQRNVVKRNLRKIEDQNEVSEGEL